VRRTKSEVRYVHTYECLPEDRVPCPAIIIHNPYNICTWCASILPLEYVCMYVVMYVHMLYTVLHRTKRIGQLQFCTLNVDFRTPLPQLQRFCALLTGKKTSLRFSPRKNSTTSRTRQFMESVISWRSICMAVLIQISPLDLNKSYGLSTK
jgi:hypothetical protein